MIKRLIQLLVGAAILWMAWHAIPVYWNYFQFNDAVSETARFAGSRSEEEIRARVLVLAADHQVPLNPEALVVRIDKDVTEILAPYTERVELLPHYYYDWAFDVKIAAWHVR